MIDLRGSNACNGKQATQRSCRPTSVDTRKSLLARLVRVGHNQGHRKRHPKLKVLFTSGYAKDAISRQRGLGRGDELLIKPYKRETLARKVRGVLDAPHDERISEKP